MLSTPPTEKHNIKMQICCQANYSLTALRVTWLDLIRNIAVTPSPITSNSGLHKYILKCLSCSVQYQKWKATILLAMENQKTNKQTKTHKNPKNLADRTCSFLRYISHQPRTVVS